MLNHHLMILLANSKTKLVLSQSSQYSERENRIRQQYLNGVLPALYTSLHTDGVHVP